MKKEYCNNWRFPGVIILQDHVNVKGGNKYLLYSNEYSLKGD
jgi:hypothetical protein